MNAKQKKKRIQEIEKQLKQLDKNESPLRKERNQLQTEMRLEYDKKFIGRCYKFKNSGGDNFKTWWLYIQVMDLSPDYGLTVLKAQKYNTEYNNGYIEVIREQSYSNNFKDSASYIPISEDEFNNAVQAILIDLWRKK